MADFTSKRTKRLKDSVQDYPEIIGKIQPQAVDMESAVLGAMMLDRNAVLEVIDQFQPETFYQESHKIIFQAIKNLVEKNKGVDILTVTAELRVMGELDAVGGAYAITQLTNRVSSAAHIEYHAAVVIQKYLQRELISVSGEILKDSYEETADVFELMDNAEQRLFAVKDSSIKKKSVELNDLLSQATKQIQSTTENNGVTGVPSGLHEVDKITAGWQKADLIIIAARPGMGKTAFVLSAARNAAVDFKVPVAIFSLEMSSIQLVTRLIAGETELGNDKLKRGNLMDYEWKQYNSRITKLSGVPIFIDDTPSLSIFDLRAKCRRLKAQKGIGLVIIDYLQLMRSDDKKSGNREQEISYISRNLKGLAKDLDIPVIALAQLSREAEKTTDKRPLLSHLRESGSIEQDADVVGFLYRPEYYNFLVDEEGNDLKGIGELIISKHRNGATGTAKLRFIDQFAKFTNLDKPSFSMEDYNPTINVNERIEPVKDDDEGIPF